MNTFWVSNARVSTRIFSGTPFLCGVLVCWIPTSVCNSLVSSNLKEVNMSLRSLELHYVGYSYVYKLCMCLLLSDKHTIQTKLQVELELYHKFTVSLWLFFFICTLWIERPLFGNHIAQVFLIVFAGLLCFAVFFLITNRFLQKCSWKELHTTGRSHWCKSK